MIKVDVKVNGLNKALQNIDQFNLKVQKAVKDVVNESALNVQAGAKQRSPVDTGRLRASIAIEPQSQAPYVVRVGTNVQYAEAIEFGTAPRVITPTNKKALFWKGASHPVKKVNHPGTKAKPFLFPAWEEERPQFLIKLGEALKNV
jgi:HK97 gp10 family phage protein